jgi:hypothetical protein
VKKMIVGIIIGAFLATAIPVAAEQVNKKVTATIRTDFTLQVDGVNVNLENSPLAFEGKSYLPVAEVARAVGKEVGFKDGVIKLDTVKNEEAESNTPGKPDANVNEVDINNIKSKEDFDKAISKYSIELTSFQNVVESNKAGMEEMKKQLPNTPKMQETLEMMSNQEKRFQAKIDELKRSIEELKAKYPEYANEN